MRKFFPSVGGVSVAFLGLVLFSSGGLAQNSFGSQNNGSSQDQKGGQNQSQNQGQQEGQNLQVQPSPQPNGNLQQGVQRPNFSQIEQFEGQDFGIQASGQLHTGAMHGPTPTTIPSGLVITTEALSTTLQQNPGSIAIFDVLGGGEILPNAMNAMGASAPGSFDDQTQQQFGQFLNQVTGGNKQVPVLFYCLSPQCWMSYNAALRAINLGYKQVLWYRGGIEAWKQAGLPVQTPQISNQY